MIFKIYNLTTKRYYKRLTEQRDDVKAGDGIMIGSHIFTVDRREADLLFVHPGASTSGFLQALASKAP